MPPLFRIWLLEISAFYFFTVLGDEVPYGEVYQQPNSHWFLVQIHESSSSVPVPIVLGVNLRRFLRWPRWSVHGPWSAQDTESQRTLRYETPELSGVRSNRPNG